MNLRICGFFFTKKKEEEEMLFSFALLAVNFYHKETLRNHEVTLRNTFVLLYFAFLAYIFAYLAVNFTTKKHEAILFHFAFLA